MSTRAQNDSFWAFSFDRHILYVLGIIKTYTESGRFPGVPQWSTTMLQIDTTGEILLDGKRTSLGLTQRQNGTVIYTRENLIKGLHYREHAMPHERYSTVHAAPASGAAGIHTLEADIRALLVTLTA